MDQFDWDDLKGQNLDYVISQIERHIYELAEEKFSLSEQDEWIDDMRISIAERDEESIYELMDELFN